MPRGGARVGAGRPKMTEEAKQEALLRKQAVMMDEFLVPSFRASNLGRDEVTMSPDVIEKAYGRDGLRVWKTWYSISTPATGLGRGRGHTTTKWRLKLKMTIAAKTLLDKVETELPFPSDVVREVIHRKEYDAWCKEHQKHMTEFAREFGHRVVPPPPYTAWKTSYKPLDIKPNAPSSKEQFLAWRELIDGESQGYSTPYEGFVPDEKDVPY